MIRTALALFLLTVVVVIAAALLVGPGLVTLAWPPWQAQMTAAAALILLTAFTLGAALLWRLVFWLIAAPRRMGEDRARRRRNEALQALTAGLTALAAGDRPLARSQAEKAAGLSSDTAPVARALTALAADPPAAPAPQTPAPDTPPQGALASPPSPAK